MLEEIQGTTQRMAMMALDAYAMRHQVIANNIANINADNFRPVRLNFEAQLQKLQDAVGSGASDVELRQLTDQIQPFVETETDDTPLADQKVRLDQEMALMVQNTVQYEAVLTAVGKSNALMRMAITGESS